MNVQKIGGEERGNGEKRTALTKECRESESKEENEKQDKESRCTGMVRNEKMTEL